VIKKLKQLFQSLEEKNIVFHSDYPSIQPTHNHFNSIQFHQNNNSNPNNNNFNY